jgi:4-hydroxy-tetrahydrodipicolinate synthase
MSQAFLVTISCFDAEGRLDLGMQRAVWERSIAAGVGLYVGSASPGEGYALERDEVGALLRLAVEMGGGRVPVRAMGVEPRTGAQMLDLLSLAADSGVDAAQIYSLDIGHGGRPTEIELERYLRLAIEASQIPVVLSSHMSVGYLVPPALVERLAKDYAQLVGINVTTPEIPYLCDIIDRVGGRLEICVGGPMHAMTVLALGGDGFLCTEAAFVPALCSALAAHWDSGEFGEAHVAYAEIMHWLCATCCVPGMSVRRTKAMLALQGVCESSIRDPHAELEPAEIETLRHELRRQGLRWERA